MRGGGRGCSIYNYSAGGIKAFAKKTGRQARASHARRLGTWVGAARISKNSTSTSVYLSVRIFVCKAF